jgi:YkoY family integral membrane protein
VSFFPTILRAFAAQRFDVGDVPVIGILIVVEGLLSIDNALILGMLARRLPVEKRTRALTYGLGGAMLFRFCAIAAASWLLQSRIVMLLGALYLLFLALRHFCSQRREKSGSIVVTSGRPVQVHPPGASPSSARFWPTVVAIELTDISVAADSILAAIALVTQNTPAGGGANPKLWVVMTAAMLGVVLMRGVAHLFIHLLERFPRFESSAYLLVGLIGLRLMLVWHFDAPGSAHPLNFHDPADWPFWAFWFSMTAALAVGFISERRDRGTR